MSILLTPTDNGNSVCTGATVRGETKGRAAAQTDEDTDCPRCVRTTVGEGHSFTAWCIEQKEDEKRAVLNKIPFPCLTLENISKPTEMLICTKTSGIHRSKCHL